MADTFQIVAVSTASPSWQGPIALNPDFQPEHLMLYDKSTTAIVEYSFDGSTLHGELDPADGTRGKTFDNRKHTSIWLRIKSGSTGPANVSCESWNGAGS